MRHSGFWSGTTYPILLRILDAGWVRAEWETGDPQELGRPLMRQYSIEAPGVSALMKWQESKPALFEHSHTKEAT